MVTGGQKKCERAAAAPMVDVMTHLLMCALPGDEYLRSVDPFAQGVHGHKSTHTR